MFALKTDKEIPYLQEESFFDVGARAFFSCRSDSFKKSEKFRSEFYRQQNISSENIIQPGQIHSSIVLLLEKKRHYSSHRPLPADAVMTSCSGAVLQGLFADCVPIFIFHPPSGVRVLVHSGWRGTSRGIVKKAISILSERFSVKPEECLASIGPAISQKHYEVGKDIFQMFKLRLPKLIAEQGDEFFCRRSGCEKYFLSLKKANYFLMMKSGMRKDFIEVSDKCTFSHPLLYSYRQEGEQAGRMIALFDLFVGRK